MIGSGTAVVVVLAALGLFAAVGFRTRLRDESVEDYLVARNSQRSAALGLSFLASGLGAWILFAPPEVGAFVGLVAVAGYALGAAGPIVAFALLGPRLRKTVPAGHTLTEFVRERYGRAFHTFVIGVSILYMLVFLTAELTAVGGVTAILSGADPRWAVVATAAVTLAYTAYGGLRASLRTDRWQAWLLMALLAAAAAAVLDALPDARQAVTGSGLLGVNRVGVEAALTLIIAVTVANLFHQGYWQRVWAARDSSTLIRGAAIGGVAVVPIVLVVGLLGIVAAGTGAELGASPVPFFALLVDSAPWVAVAVLALGVSLVASSVDTLQNGLAALVVAERPRTSLAGARLVTALLMVPAALVALQGLSVLRLFLIADLLCAAVAAPALLGLWSRATARGALAGGVAGLVGAVVPGWKGTGSLWEGVWLATFPDAVPTLPPFAGALLASSVVAVVVSLAERRVTDLAAVGARIPLLGERPPQDR
jgi:solute:Na+ symporter, SSS family